MNSYRLVVARMLFQLAHGFRTRKIKNVNVNEIKNVFLCRQSVIITTSASNRLARTDQFLSLPLHTCSRLACLVS